MATSNAPDNASAETHGSSTAVAAVVWLAGPSPLVSESPWQDAGTPLDAPMAARDPMTAGLASSVCFRDKILFFMAPAGG